jgi:hypothetical protein
MVSHFTILDEVVNRRMSGYKKGDRDGIARTFSLEISSRSAHVDFALLRASVISRNSVKISRLKKSVAAFGLLVAVTLGGFALCLAHDHVPADSTFLFNLRLGSPNGVSQSDDSLPRFRLDLVTGDVPPSMQKVPLGARIFDEAPTESVGSLIYPRAYAPKIARHMLDSRLLI